MQALWGFDWPLSPTTLRNFCYIQYSVNSDAAPPSAAQWGPLYFPPSFYRPYWLHFSNVCTAIFMGFQEEVEINTCIPFASFNQRNHLCNF